MLRLNRETDYAIRVILALAKYPRSEIIPSEIIRQEMLLPRSLSLQIISRLARHQLINTFPGRHGGIQLAHPPSDINLYQVIRVMEGPLVLSECLEEDHNCQLEPDCPIQQHWIAVGETLEKQLKSISFNDLLAESSNSQKGALQNTIMASQ